MQGTVRYSEEFIKPDGLKGWFSHEKQYDQDTQDPPFEEIVRTVRDEIKKHSDLFTLTVSNPSRISVGEIQVDKPEETRIGILVEDIMSCLDIPTIDSYRLLVKGKPELEAAYEKRREEIKQAEIKDIMDRTNALTQKNK